MKTGSFISSIITFALSAIATYLCAKISDGTLISGESFFTTLLSLPLTGILYCLLAGFLLSTLLTAISAITSQITAIKVISVIIAALTVLLIIYNMRGAINLYHTVLE